MPSLLAYVEQFHKLPQCLAVSLAFYAAFYKGVRLEDAGLIGVRGENEYTIQDDRAVLEFYAAHKDDDSAAYARAVLGNEAFWGRDLTAVPGLEDAVAGYLEQIRTEGAYAVMKSLL
jgi:tagaturonate reductase